MILFTATYEEFRLPYNRKKFLKWVKKSKNYMQEPGEFVPFTAYANRVCNKVVTVIISQIF